MPFSRRKIRNNALQGDGPPVVVQTRRRSARNNRCRALALAVACCALNLGSNFVAVAEAAPKSNELLEQGRKLLEAGKLAEAEAVLDRAEKLAPSDPVILTLDGEVKGRLGEYASAVALLKRVIQLTPKSAQARVNLAIALADSDDFDNALAETTTAIALAPGSAIAHFNRARILYDLKQDQKADDEFALAAHLAPGNSECYYYWSLSQRTQGNFAKETELLRKVVKLEPGNLKAHIMLANSLLDQDQTAEAVPELRIALSIDPNSEQATYELSHALLKADPEESKRLRGQFERLRARDAAVDQAKTVANQGFYAYAAQNWRESIRLYSEALETCGDCEIESVLRRNLGLALCRNGQIEQGTEEIRKALALNPEDRDAAKALEVISALNNPK
jgi:tetratricopeptide (TPR) repeat protein